MTSCCTVKLKSQYGSLEQSLFSQTPQKVDTQELVKLVSMITAVQNICSAV